MNCKSFSFNPFSENTYVIYNDEKKAYLIDPGNYSPEETQILAEFIEGNSLQIQNIILTHAHIDHVLGLQWAYDTFKVPVMLHKWEEEILNRNPMTAKQYGFFLKPFEGELIFISEEECVYLGDDELEVIFVPGHSPGHIALYNKKEKWIISGDVLFQGSVGRTDLYKGDYHQLMQSIKEKIESLDDEVTVLPGHGPKTTVGFEKKYNPFLK